MQKSFTTAFDNALPSTLRQAETHRSSQKDRSSVRGACRHPGGCDGKRTSAPRLADRELGHKGLHPG